MREFRVGQRVQARFGRGEWRLGVVSGERYLSCQSVQFQPVGAHFACYVEDSIRAYGDANGWTDAEYRIEREKSYCETRAVDVERERRERYPEKPFSMYPGNRHDYATPDWGRAA